MIGLTHVGYKYKYPFLSPECGVRVEDNHVQPLFKHFLNIEHPTMYFIGIPTNTTGFCMFDLQVKTVPEKNPCSTSYGGGRNDRQV